MQKCLNIVTPLHKSTARDYLGRMTDDKVHCMDVARRYGHDFWDGQRRYGYGGYRYDGRWEQVARSLIDTYDLKDDARILDVGCGKGFLIYELKKLLPTAHLQGFDISEYAINNAKEEIRDQIFVHRAQDRYPFEDQSFDLVLSITTLHNLCIHDLVSALRRIQRVGKEKYLVLESYRSAKELFNLQCWALTCQSFFSPQEWQWLFERFGYTGDYEFIFFE